MIGELSLKLCLKEEIETDSRKSVDREFQAGTLLENVEERVREGTIFFCWFMRDWKIGTPRKRWIISSENRIWVKWSEIIEKFIIEY